MCIYVYICIYIYIYIHIHTHIHNTYTYARRKDTGFLPLAARRNPKPVSLAVNALIFR